MVNQYIRRVLKTIIQFVVIMGLMLVIIILTSKGSSQEDYSKLFKSDGMMKVLYFIGGIALFYPLFAYAKKKVYLNNNFEADRKFIEEIFMGAQYVLVKEEEGKLYFRPKNKFHRFMRLYEDTIVLEYFDDNTITMEGMRKDVFRLARYIERFAQRS